METILRYAQQQKQMSKLCDMYILKDKKVQRIKVML